MIPTQELIQYFFVPSGQTCSRVDFNIIYKNIENIIIYINDVIINTGYTITGQYVTFDPVITGIANGTTIKVSLEQKIKKTTDITSTLIVAEELNNFLDDTTLQIQSLSNIKENTPSIIIPTEMNILLDKNTWVSNASNKYLSKYFDSVSQDDLDALLAQGRGTQYRSINEVNPPASVSGGMLVYNLNNISITLPTAATPTGTLFYISQQTPIINITNIGIIKTLGVYIVYWDGATWQSIGVDEVHNNQYAITKATQTIAGIGTNQQIPVDNRIDPFELIPTTIYTQPNKGILNADLTIIMNSIDTITEYLLTITLNGDSGQTVSTVTSAIGNGTYNFNLSLKSTTGFLTMRMPTQLSHVSNLVKWTSNLSNNN